MALIVLVGPVAAGKTTFTDKLAREGVVVVSSDAIREELTGDFRDQTKNREVFDIFHRRIRDNLKAGRDVVADATHMKFRDLVKTIKAGLAGGEDEFYIVAIDRPLEDKLRDGGWRLDVIRSDGKNLVEYMHDRFRSIDLNDWVRRLKNRFPEVTFRVIDHRK